MNYDVELNIETLPKHSEEMENIFEEQKTDSTLIMEKPVNSSISSTFRIRK